MTNLGKILIVGLVTATSITAAVAATTFSTAASSLQSGKNITVIYKSNAQWPVKGFISVEPCNIRACVEA
jgi:hypothetical protein